MATIGGYSSLADAPPAALPRNSAAEPAAVTPPASAGCCLVNILAQAFRALSCSSSPAVAPIPRITTPTVIVAASAPLVTPYDRFLAIHWDNPHIFNHNIPELLGSLFTRVGSLDFDTLPLALREKVLGGARSCTTLDIRSLDIQGADLSRLVGIFSSLQTLHLSAKNLNNNDMSLFAVLDKLSSVHLEEAHQINTVGLEKFIAVRALRRLAILKSQLAENTCGYRVATQYTHTSIATLYSLHNNLAEIHIDEISFARPDPAEVAAEQKAEEEAERKAQERDAQEPEADESEQQSPADEHPIEIQESDFDEAPTEADYHSD